jgi:DNA polymerase-3 subunit delta
MAPAVTMNPIDLAVSLKRDGVGPLYALVGEEDYLRDQALGNLRAATLDDPTDPFNCDVVYGDEATADDILTCALAPPVFARRRLVVVRQAERLPARESERLLDYLQHPCESATVVFVAAKLDGRLKFSQSLAQASTMVNCNPPWESQLGPWVSLEATRLGVVLDASATAALKEVAGESLYAMRAELEKLAAYVPPGRKADASDVAALRGKEPGASAFDLAEAIANGHRARALWILARTIEAGEPPLKTLGALVWQYRRIWKCKEQLRLGRRDGEVTRMLRMDLAAARRFVGMFSDEDLRAAWRRFAETDGLLKGGSAGAGVRIMEALLLALCDRQGNAGSSPTAPGPHERRQTPTGKKLSNVRTVKTVKQSAR